MFAAKQFCCLESVTFSLLSKVAYHPRFASTVGEVYNAADYPPHGSRCVTKCTKQEHKASVVNHKPPLRSSVIPGCRQDTLEVFIEGAETNNERSGSKKMKKFLSKVVSRKHDDSSDDEAPPESASGVGDAEEALDGHLFSVGVAFAQVSRCTPATLQLSHAYNSTCYRSAAALLPCFSCHVHTIPLTTISSGTLTTPIKRGHFTLLQIRALHGMECSACCVSAL